MNFNDLSTVASSSSSSSSIDFTKITHDTTPIPGNMMLMRDELRDIFPTKIITRENDSTIKFLSSKSFRNHVCQAHPFILFKFIGSDHVSYYGGSSPNNTMDEQNQKRLFRLLKVCSTLDIRTGRENVAWSKLEDSYKKLPICFRKKQSNRKLKNPNLSEESREREEHADTRLGYRFDNMFAVKANFTFGERKTNFNEYHIIQTSHVPLLYNEPKQEFKKVFLNLWEKGSDEYYSSREGRFDPSEQKYFYTFVLNAFSWYIIPENTVYILISVQKTLFAVDRITCEMFHEIISSDERYKSTTFLPPNSHKNLMAELIDKPMRPSALKKMKYKSIDYERNWVYNDELKPPELVESTSSSTSLFSAKNIDHYPPQNFQPTICFEQCPMIMDSPHISPLTISTAASTQQHPQQFFQLTSKEEKGSVDHSYATTSKELTAENSFQLIEATKQKIDLFCYENVSDSDDNEEITPEIICTTNSFLENLSPEDVNSFFENYVPSNVDDKLKEIVEDLFK